MASTQPAYEIAPDLRDVVSARGIRRLAVGPRTGFWIIAAAYLLAMTLNALPTPLYPLYQARDGFSTFMVTVIFGVYAVGLAVSLLLMGHVSDWVGRKRVLVVALALEVLCALIFWVFPGLPGLLVGRVVGGLGIGMITATATAHLNELHKAHRPDHGPGLFEVVSTGANVGGIALGPLIAGALAQYVTEPLRVPYILFAALLVLAIVAVAAVPETVEILPARPSYRPQKVSLNHGDRALYIAAGAIAFAAFAIMSVYTAFSAEFVAGTLHRNSHLLAGTVAFALAAAATVSQVTTSRLSLQARQRGGLAAGAVGFILLAIGVADKSLTIFLLAGIIGGAGSGMLLKSAIGVVAAIAAPERRGEALAGLFLFCYAGMAVPAISVGLAVEYVSLTTAIYCFSATLLCVLAATGVLTSRRTQRTSAPDAI